ncbi:MAG: roadblock/LC7 domain-containing protein [Alcaligenaceae bacterium]|nr:MAG: roadblock/LC7 domain-containing protein [Alcaligenaceae bacterium]
MKSSLSIVPETLAVAGQSALQAHVSSLHGLQLALLVTPDGFEIACLRNRSELQTNRISAMASSLMAMARAVGREIKSPACKRLTFEAQGSTVIFQSIDAGTPCILCLVLGPDAVLGHALWATTGVGQAMSRT